MPLKRRIRAIGVGLTLMLVVALFAIDYTVERGDTLGEIAKEHGVTLDDILAINDISNANLIYPGQVIVIPGENGQPDQIHVVGRGENLSKIAVVYGTTTSIIVEANSLKNPNLIFPGQELTIPGPGPANTSSSSSNQASPSPASSTAAATYHRSGANHIVKRGETLESIAAKYKGVSATDIAKANGITNNLVYTGTRMFLDGPGYVAEGTLGEIRYTVKSGDRLGDIAAKHRTSVKAIASTNSISNVNLIRSGQTLKIPSGTAWICPVPKTSFFNDWGFPRSGGSRFHEGNDLFASRGLPVQAPVSGTVEFITGTVGGYQFSLTGDDGVVYLGSHMESFEGKNRRVGAGEVLGYVGTSGNAQGTRPHLHFGMYISGYAVNPYPTLIEQGCK